MKKLIFIYFPLGFFIVILLVMFTLRHLNVKEKSDENKTVFIKKIEKGYQLIRNGKPFYIQGAGGNAYLKELADFGGNTIRLYDTTNIMQILNEAQKNNIAVIVDISLPQYSKKYKYYSNEDSTNILKQKVKILVHKIKDHPALLMWNLGNELYYPFVLRKNSFIYTFNDLIDIIHTEDPNHPVTTAFAGISRLSVPSLYIHSPELDLISFNLFNNIKYLKTNLAQINLLFGARPYYISELGADGTWESQWTAWGAEIEKTSTKKVEQIRARYDVLNKNMDEACIGTLVFYWGNKWEGTFTWFSLFMYNYKSEIIKELENIWKGSNTKASLIGLEYMLVDGKGTYDNIIFAPNQFKNAEIKFIGNTRSDVEIKWEIYPEGWPWLWLVRQENRDEIFNPLIPLDSFVSYEKNRATFITPDKEGPYRIFAYVYDKDGFFASTNTPFYVLNSK
jgi:hypothetical protein